MNHISTKKSNTHVPNLGKRVMETSTRVTAVKKAEGGHKKYTAKFERKINQLGDKLKIEQGKERRQGNCLNGMKYII